MARAQSAPRHIPLRRCTSCRSSRAQGELLRFYQVRIDETQVWRFDAARRAGGRGTWLCADTPSCWELKKLRRTFRAQAEEVHALLQTLPQTRPQTGSHNPVDAQQPRTTNPGSTLDAAPNTSPCTAQAAISPNPQRP